MHAKIEKTKHALLMALIRLMKTTEMGEITVSQLCQEAEINRTTFYKYYSVPLDVIEEFIQKVLDQMLSFDQSTAQNLYEYMVMVCRLVYDNGEIMRIYTDAKGSLMPLFHAHLLRQRNSMSFMKDGRNRFIAGGVSSTLMAWVVEGFPQTPEEIARAMTEWVSLLQGSAKEEA